MDPVAGVIWYWDVYVKGDERRQKPDERIATIEAPNADDAARIANHGCPVGERRYITIGERHWIEKRKQEVAR